MRLPPVARWALLFVLLIPLWLLLDRSRENRPRHIAEQVEAGGLRWRILRGGTGDTTLVLVHGYGEHLLGWRAIFDRLALHHRVVAIDLPGFGITDKPDTVYSLNQMATWLRSFLDQETRGPLVLIGHSMGGAVVSATALASADRIVQVILIAPAGLSPGLGRIGDLVGERGQGIVGWWQSARAFITPVHDPDWLAEPARMAEYDPIADSGYRSVTARMLREFDFGGIGEDFRKLAVPTLVIWGRFDPVIPFETADSLIQLLPCGQLAALNAMHRPQMEQPDTTAVLTLGFLRSGVCY